MKKLAKDMVLVVITTIIIVGSYALFDIFYSYRPNIVVNRKVLSPRNFFVFEGKERNERKYVRVLVLDVNGDGIKTGRADLKHNDSSENFYFDYNNDSFGELAPVLGKDDALLVYKENKNELKGGDIIGNSFEFSKLGSEASSFDVLKEINQGQNRIILDAPLTEKIKLLVIDYKTNVAEYTSLLEPLIQKIDKSITLDIIKHKELNAEGNVLGDYVEVELKSGIKSKIQEVWLYTNPTIYGYHKQVKIDDDISKLPDLKGTGSMYSLQETMQIDKSQSLKNLVIKYINEPNYFLRQAMLLDVIYNWGGVENADVKSRISEDGKNYIGDARKVLLLEKIQGEVFRGTHSGFEETNAPHHLSAPVLLEAFNNFTDYTKSVLLPSGLLKEFIEQVKLSWNADKNKWEIDVKELFENMRKFHTQYGELQTRLLLDELYFAIDNIVSTFKLEIDIMNVFRNSGEFINAIDMKDFGKMVLRGTSRSDTINGSDYGDIFLGRDGNDVLNGGLGNDVYIFALNDGDDTIMEQNGDNLIAFVGNIFPENISFMVDGLDLLIKINSGENGSIRIKNYNKNENYKIENLLFANNKIIKLDDAIIAKN